MRQLYTTIVNELNRLLVRSYMNKDLIKSQPILISIQNSKVYEAPFKKTQSLLSLVLVCMIISTLFHTSANAALITTANSGNWSSGTSWNGGIVPASTDNITVNHNLTLNTGLTISGAGTLTFRSNSSGTQTINISAAATGGLIIENSATVTFGSNSNINGGSIIVRSGSTLNIGSISTSNAVILVETGGVLNVTGTINNNGSLFTVNGLMTVTGSYQGANANAHIEGSGEVTTTQSMTSMNGGSIFGVVNGSCTPVAPALCYGKSLSSTCAGVTAASLTPASTNACSASAVTLSLSYTGSGTISYQWQQRSGSSSTYSVISGATTASYNATPTATLTYYRVKVSSTNGNCFRYSNVASLLGGSAPVVAGITGNSTVCKGTSITLSSTTASGTWSSGSTSVATVSSGGVVTGVAAGTSVISYTVTSGGCTTTTTKSITVNTCINTWIGVTSANWSTDTNWSSGSAPIASDSVLVSSGTPNSPVISTSIHSGQISISSGAALNITSTGILNAYGNVINNGTLTAASGSTVAFKGSSSQTITGVPILYNVEIANTSGGVSLSSAAIIKGALTLTSGVLTTNSNLTINFDNGGHIAYNASDAGSISGNVSGRRDAVARTHYIAAPFNGVTSNQVNVTSPLFYNGYWKMYTKNFMTQGWTAVMTTTTDMSPGTGFSLAMPAAAPLILTGTYSHNYSYTGTTYANTAAAKYILIGNPYPTALDWNASSGWTKTNVSNAVYYWNAASGTVSSYVAGVGANGGTQYIPAMQSFMVTTTGTGGSSSISIDNAARVNLQNPSFMRTTGDDEIIRIKLTGANADVWDDAVIRFNEMATTAFDYEWDAYKIITLGSSPLVYTSLGGNVYSINSVSEVDSMKAVDVVVYLPANGNYTFSIANSDPNIECFLVDWKLGTTNMLSASGYVFNGATADDKNRFQLLLRKAITTGTNAENTATGLQINSSTKGFVIQTKQYSGSIASIEIMDVTGRLIQSITDKNLSEVTYLPLDLADGAYVIKVHVNNTVFVHMITLTK